MNSLLLYPVINNENQQVIGFLEVANNCLGHFEHDDEYMAELILPTISSLTLKTYSNHSIVTMNRMKDDLIKFSHEMLGVDNFKDLIIVSEKWLCSIFSVNQARVCLVTKQTIQRLDKLNIVEVSKSVGLTGMVAETKIAEHIKDPYNNVHFNLGTDLEVTLPIYFIPIVDKNKTVAVLQLPYKNIKSSNSKHNRMSLTQSPVVYAFGKLLSGFIKLVERVQNLINPEF